LRPAYGFQRFVLSKDGVLLTGAAADWGQAKGAANVIDIFEALGWLNEIDNLSYLNYEAFQLISEARRCSLSDREVRQIVRSLRIIGRSSMEPFQKGETLLHCAAIQYSRNWFPQAFRDALDTVPLYQEDDYRRAVAFWLIGATQWNMLHNHAAYSNWDKARKLFQKQQIFFQQSALDVEQHKSRIRRMEVQLAARPEESMTWLNLFEESSLRLPVESVVKCVREKVRKQECQNSYELMQDFQEANRRSKNVYERAEISLEFGLAIYQLGNVHCAIDLMRKAVQNFYPGVGTYHKQVVARCMLGAMEWMNQPPDAQAEEDWTQTIEGLEKLRTIADRNNDFQRRTWYTDHRRILKEALDEQLPHPRR
jgi:tetratricopeptide (TPR) repeat protein